MTDYDVERDSGAISFFDDSRTPVAGEVVNVSMGSGTISAPELAGNVTIPLPTKYGDVEHGQEVRREAYLVIEDAQYAVSLERLGRNYHRVILTPANHTAKRTELVYAGDRIEDRPGVRVEGASLTAAFSDSLNFYRKATIFDGDLDNPLINSMEFEFAGHIPPTATSLTFSVQGGSRIRGPFIFEGVHLVPR